MLDPLTSLGVASNVIQLAHFFSRVIENAYDLSKQGITAERMHLRKLVADTKAISRELEEQLGPVPSKDVNFTAPDPLDSVLTQSIDMEFVMDKSASSEVTWKPNYDRKKPSDPKLEKVRTLASDTKDAAEELEKLLQHIDINKGSGDDLVKGLESGPAPKRRRLSTKKARNVAGSLFNGFRYGERLEEMKDKMQDLQQSMILRLVAVQSISQNTLLKSLDSLNTEFSKERDRRLAAYEKSLSEFEHHPGCTADQCKQFLLRMKEFTAHGHTTSKCQRILRTLVFQEVHSREDSIPDAHANTFSWIFENDITGFKEWASSKSGVFWVTGKPGCGKSTLMKYIVQDRRTPELLHQWSGTDDLVIAHHYFWNAGTAMQKSQVGLLRTLLFYIVQQSPELAAECLPSRFLKESCDDVSPWTYKELREAILRLGQETRQGVRLCFFIDGLDEYEGEPIDLIALISTIAESPSIKVCVSSRPWNAFTRAYHKRVDGEIEVQDLTVSDIELYVNNKINDNRQFRELRDRNEEKCAKLVQSITHKAQGVFLWVYLVVRSLIRGLTNGDDLKILHRRLDSYPDTLDGYFRRMYDRIEGVYRMESSRLMIATLSAEKPLPFWAPRCIELETENPNYAIAVQVPPSRDEASLIYGCDCARSSGEFSFAADARNARSTLPALNKPDDEINHNCYYLFGEDTVFSSFASGQREKLRRYLDARCADLLEVHPDGVGFIHRTAKDFLAHSDLSLELYARAGSEYDVGLCLARLAVVDAKRESRMRVFGLHSARCRAILQFKDYVREPNRSSYDELVNHLLGKGIKVACFEAN